MAVRNGVPDAALGDLYPFQDRYARLSDGTTPHHVEWGGRASAESGRIG